MPAFVAAMAAPIPAAPPPTMATFAKFPPPQRLHETSAVSLKMEKMLRGLGLAGKSGAFVGKLLVAHGLQAPCPSSRVSSEVAFLPRWNRASPKSGASLTAHS